MTTLVITHLYPDNNQKKFISSFEKTNPLANVIKLFTAAICKFCNKLKRLSLASQPSLMFVGKARSLPLRGTRLERLI
jgi:hypothetical protein